MARYHVVTINHSRGYEYHDPATDEFDDIEQAKGRCSIIRSSSLRTWSNMNTFKSRPHISYVVIDTTVDDSVFTLDF